MQEEEKKKSKKHLIIILILLLLLLISAGALVAHIAYLNSASAGDTTVIVPDNLISGDSGISGTTPSGTQAVTPGESTEPNASTPQSDTTTSSDTAGSNIGSTNSNSGNSEQEATTIELYKGQPSDNELFEVTNMLPGDSETKYFAVKVSHHADVTVYFNAEVTAQTKNLANVLHIKVTHLENGKVIYDGTFADMDIDGYGETFAADESTETVAYYKIEVSLPTEAGNEYQASTLLADFEWLVRDTEVLDTPQTGDDSNILLWFIVMMSSLVMMLILLFARRKTQEEKQNAN